MTRETVPQDLKPGKEDEGQDLRILLKRDPERLLHLFEKQREMFSDLVGENEELHGNLAPAEQAKVHAEAKALKLAESGKRVSKLKTKLKEARAGRRLAELELAKAWGFDLSRNPSDLIDTVRRRLKREQD